MNFDHLWKVWKHESHLKARTLRQMELPSWIQSLSNLAIKPVKPHQTYRPIARIHEFTTRVMRVSVYQILSLCLQTLTAYDFETEAITRLRNAVTWPQQTPANLGSPLSFSPAGGVFPTQSIINIQLFMIYIDLSHTLDRILCKNLLIIGSEGKTRKKVCKSNKQCCTCCHKLRLTAAKNFEIRTLRHRLKNLDLLSQPSQLWSGASPYSECQSSKQLCLGWRKRADKLRSSGCCCCWGVLSPELPELCFFQILRLLWLAFTLIAESPNRRIVDAMHMCQSNPMDTFAWNTLPGSPWTSAPKTETDASRSMVTDGWILIHSYYYSQLDGNFTENCATKLMRLSNLGCFSLSRLFGVYSWGALRSHCQWHFILLHWSCQRRSHESRGREVVYLRLIIKRSAW